jgi:hypothetical protein
MQEGRLLALELMGYRVSYDQSCAVGFRNPSVPQGVTVLKMRGSKHAKGIYEFTIDGHGMHIGSSPFRHVGGIVTGDVVRIPPNEVDRASKLFKEKSFRNL